MKVKELVIFSFLIAILFVGQVALAAIPNVEIVSLLVVIYTKVFRKKVFFIIYGFSFFQSYDVPIHYSAISRRIIYYRSICHLVDDVPLYMEYIGDCGTMFP